MIVPEDGADAAAYLGACAFGHTDIDTDTIEDDTGRVIMRFYRCGRCGFRW